MTDQTPKSVSLSPTAIKVAKEQLSKRNSGTNDFLRIGLRGGGCVGYSYHLAFTDKQEPRDMLFEFDGLKVLVDPKSMLYLDGAVLDYEVSLMKRGYIFRNPNAKSTCGCGESFSAEAK